MSYEIGTTALPDFGIRFLSDFWEDKYLKKYIPNGGSKVKFVTGQGGSGKTHFLKLMSASAREMNYQVVQFSARSVWLHDFKSIYMEILKQCDLMECLRGCSQKIIGEMGYRVEEIPEGMTFLDYLASEGMADALTRRELREQLKKMFLDNPLLDNNFAIACSRLTGSLLGHPVLEESNKALLLSWLSCEPSVKLTQLRPLGLSPSKITKYNARHMLRSLAEVVRLGGFSGLFVTIDELEILISGSSLEELHYTKVKREDTYESIRQLIDDIDSMHNIMFVFAFHRDLMDNKNAGIKSYQALWMRIQNEVSGEHFNRFADIVDLDRLAVQEYTPQVLVEISESLAQSMQSFSVVPITKQQAEEILKQVKIGVGSVPKLIYNTMTEGETYVTEKS